MSHMTYLEASVVGLIQGVTELFPVSSLGHNVLIPALVGGSWATDLNVAAPESPYLAYIVGLHVATALAMMIYFWRDWVRLIKGFFSSIRHGRIETVDEKLAWMIVIATIPVGVVGLGFEHPFRVLFGKPILAAVFLVVNGGILFSGERFRTKASKAADAALAASAESADGHPERMAASHGTAAVPGAPLAQDRPLAQDPALARDRPLAQDPALATGTAGGSGPPASATAGPSDATLPMAAVTASRGYPGGPPAMPEEARHASGQRAARKLEVARAVQADGRLSGLGYVQAMIIGSAQILALLAGISRDGVVMVTGMFRGLSRQDAARFSFLLSTPVILAAGVLKVPDLVGPLGNGIHGQILVGSILSGVGAYVSVRYLMKYFQTRTLTPFAIYCFLFGLGSIIYLSVR
jgi:undecaprenyl-diphosphatase